MGFRRKLSVERARVKGRYDGANETPCEAFLEQVDHTSERRARRIEHDASNAIRKLEAHKAHSSERLEQKRTRLDEITASGRPKALLYGLIFLIMFVAASSSEAYLLTPTMRGFGMAEPLIQLLTAAGIVFMGAIILKFVYTESRHYFAMPPDERSKSPNWKLQRILLPCMATLVLLAFLFLGAFRASEMIFANSIDPSSDLGSFVKEHESLTRAVLVLLTVMLPTASAIALSHGVEIVKDWIEWMRVRYLCWTHSRRVHHTAKALQAAQEQLDKRLAEERQQCETIKAEYRDGYNHGQRLGLHKMPIWFFVLKTVAVAFGVMFLIFLVEVWLQSHYEPPSWRWACYLTGILFITGCYGMRQWRIRERPRPEDVIWKPHWRGDQPPLYPAPQEAPDQNPTPAGAKHGGRAPVATSVTQISENGKWQRA